MADNNNYFIKLLVGLSIFLLSAEIVQAQAPCTTPNGSQGECVSIFDCPVLLNLVNKPNKSPQDYESLRKSQCGFKGRHPLVCCPSSQPTPAPTPAPAPAVANGTRCFTPDGQEGTCIGLYSCSHLSNLLQQPTSKDGITFVQNSKCQGSERYSVCCGPSAPVIGPVPRPTICTPSAAPPDPRTECCGLDASSPNRIIGGKATFIDQYPWLAIIEYQKDDKIKLLCGGVLISGKYVLTAAHCVVGPVLEVGRPINVRLGEYDTKNSGPDCVETEGGSDDCTEGALIVPIEKIISHPDYNPTHVLRRNDIALLRLRRLAPYTDFIRPICLPSSDLVQSGPADFRLFAAGWGAVSETQGSSNLKQHVDLPFKTHNECQVSYNNPRRKITLWEGQICAGGEKGKDSCKGDSGGPLMQENGTLFEVVGIVSFGPTPCGLENIPGVYTKVYEYLPWIRAQITP